MRNVTVICYLFSLLSFGMGYSKVLAYKNAMMEQVNTATSFFVLAIFFAVIGFAIYTLRTMEHKIYNEPNISDRVGNQKAIIPRKTQSVYSCDG
jgi:hypothetical protein